MTDKKTTVTMGDCLCGETTPHKKFYRDGKALHTSGFFSVEEGRGALDALVDAGTINGVDRDRLTHLLLDNELPSTREGGLINVIANSCSFSNQATLGAYLSELVSNGQMSPAGAETVRSKITAMTDEQRINTAVVQLRNQNLDDPRVKERIAEYVDPALADRVKEAAKKYQAEHPRLLVNQPRYFTIDTGDGSP